MHVDHSFTLRRKAEELIAAQAPSLPVKEIAKGLRVGTQFRTRRVDLDALKLGASRFGGCPDVPVPFEWPQWDGFVAEDLVLPSGVRYSQGDAPATLSFLAQLNLAEIPEPTGLLPDTGWLVFFYDERQQPWGFDPRHRGSSRVMYFDGDAASLSRHGTPEAAKEYELHCSEVTPELVATLPHFPDQLGLELDPPARDAYWKLSDELIAGPEPHHRLFGWPKLIQGDMELECQLASNGISCGSSAGHETEQARRLRPGAADWILLLQLDTDDCPGCMWGDSGCLYFWIRKQDLAERRFDRVWTILQCY
jgi:uncharacterized protein YwqG